MTGPVDGRVQLRTVPTADLTAAELVELRGLLDAAFAGRFSDDAWSHALGGVHVLATVEGRLAGHASVVLRQLVAGAVTLPTGYVEAVATAAPERGRGVGWAVMTEIERLVAGGFELGALSPSRQGEGLYRARGWRPWPGRTAALTPDGLVDTPDQTVFVRATPRTPAGWDAAARLVCDWRRGALW